MKSFEPVREERRHPEAKSFEPRREETHRPRREFTGDRKREDRPAWGKRNPGQERPGDRGHGRRGFGADRREAPPAFSKRGPKPDRRPSHTENLRGKAALILEEILEKRQSLKRVLQREQERLPREDDRALLREIVTGVIRNLPVVDRALAAMVKRGLNETQSELLAILRVGVFQILFLDRVPLYAAVDQCVEAAKPLNPGAGGFVNGILRAVAERKAAWLSMPEGGDAASVALRTGMPIWLLRRYAERFGPARGEAVAAAFQRPAPTALIFASEEARAEAEPLLADEGWELIPDPALPLTCTVLKGNPAFSKAFDRGLFYIMDPASQAPAALAPLRGDERVLDLCAAPGGKTIVLSRRLRDGGSVVATDVNQRRLKHLEENVRRMKLENVTMAQADVEERLPFKEAFDVVVLDAPCSSMGTLRRNPEIRWQVREEDLALRSPKQVSFLDKASRAVAPGGLLVYSVCSMEEEETLQVIAEFLRTHEDFQPSKASPPAAWQPLLEEAAPGQFFLLPDRHSWDAFFVAVLKRDASP